MFFDFFMALAFATVVFFIYKFFIGEKEEKNFLMTGFSVIAILFLFLGVAGEIELEKRIDEKFFKPQITTEELMKQMTKSHK